MRNILILAAAAAFATAAVAKPGDASSPLLKPTPSEAEAAIWATRFLTHFHYKPMPLDDAMSEKIFDRYLDSLDGDHLFFTQGDIDKFKPARDQLDDAIETRDLINRYR